MVKPKETPGLGNFLAKAKDHAQGTAPPAGEANEQPAFESDELLGQLRALVAAEIRRLEELSGTKEALSVELDALLARRNDLAQDVAHLEGRASVLRALPDLPAPGQTIQFDQLPERLRDKASDSLFVRVPAVDKEALDQAARLRRMRAQDLVRDALRAYLGEDAYKAALDALRGGMADGKQ